MGAINIATRLKVKSFVYFTHTIFSVIDSGVFSFYASQVFSIRILKSGCAEV